MGVSVHSSLAELYDFERARYHGTMALCRMGAEVSCLK